MSTLRVNSLADVAGNPSNFGIVGTAQAWVNFNGTGTVAVRASYNVSSITDNAIGNYTVNFTTSLQDQNYSVVTTASRAVDTTSSGAHSMLPITYSNSLVALLSSRGAGTAADPDYANVAIFR